MSKLLLTALSLFLLVSILTSCNEKTKNAGTDQKKQSQTAGTDQKKLPQPAGANEKSELDKESMTETEPPIVEQKPNQTVTNQPQQTPTPPVKQEEAIQVVAQPESITVLVNKQNKLPDGYNPKDLVTVAVPFASTATAEKRQLRSEAATALANLFAGANQQGISLLGVSGYRSHATQTNLFNYYVSKDGYEKARTYSAVPGTSEHETGLSIDVTGGDGSCAVQDCFANKIEGKWLQEHGSEFGYIIRYPQGKESITGYKYEPWHIRYVGTVIAKDIKSRGITLEEYYNAIPVTN